MQRVTVRIPQSLYKELKAKSMITHVSVSDIFRQCLEIGLVSLEQENPHKMVNNDDLLTLQKKIANYSVSTYYLLQASVKNHSADGDILCSNADAKADIEIALFWPEKGNGMGDGILSKASETNESVKE